MASDDYPEPYAPNVDVNNLNPIFADRLQDLQMEAEQAGIPNLMISGFRTPGVQERLFNRYLNGTGNIAAPPGQSYHNYGLAADLVAKNPAQQAALIAMARDPSRGLTVGADFNDPNHFQMRTEDVPNALAYVAAQKEKTPAVAAITSPQSPAAPTGEDLLKSYTKAPAAPAKAVPVPNAATPAPDAIGEQLLSVYSKPQPGAPVAPGLPPGSYPLGDPRNQGQMPASYKSGANDNLVNTYDRTSPISDQIIGEAKDAAGYVGGQIAGIPAAVAQDFQAGGALAAQGNQEGATLPSFPSADPKTWEAGGILKYLAGRTGQIASPLTGPIHQLIEEPITEATGNPDIGLRAGIVANTLGGPKVLPAMRAVGSKLAATAVGDISTETAQLASLARDKFGIPVNAGQMSDSPAVRFAASVAGKAPFSGAGPDRAFQQTAFNRAVSSTFGENADKITPAVMASAKTRLGAEFDDIAANTIIRVDHQFAQDMHSAVNDASITLPAQEVKPLINQIQNIYSKIDPQTGEITGDAYQALTRKGTPLDRAMNSADPNIRHYAGQIRDALDGAMERSAPPDIASRLHIARSQYKAMKAVEDLAEKSTTGDISPAALLTPVRGSYGNMAYGGGGDLADLARIGQRFLKEPPSSGTAERLTAGEMIRRVGTLGLGALGANAVAPNLIASLPENAVYAAAAIPATLLAGRAASATLRSNWLANNMINRSLGRLAPVPVNTPRNLLIGAMAGGGGLGSQNKIIDATRAPNQ